MIDASDVPVIVDSVLTTPSEPVNGLKVPGVNQNRTTRSGGSSIARPTEEISLADFANGLFPDAFNALFENDPQVVVSNQDPMTSLQDPLTWAGILDSVSTQPTDTERTTANQGLVAELEKTGMANTVDEIVRAIAGNPYYDNKVSVSIPGAGVDGFTPRLTKEELGAYISACFAEPGEAGAGSREQAFVNSSLFREMNEIAPATITGNIKYLVKRMKSLNSMEKYRGDSCDNFTQVIGRIAQTKMLINRDFKEPNARQSAHRLFDTALRNLFQTNWSAEDDVINNELAQYARGSRKQTHPSRYALLAREFNKRVAENQR